MLLLKHFQWFSNVIKLCLCPLTCSVIQFIRLLDLSTSNFQFHSDHLPYTYYLQREHHTGTQMCPQTENMVCSLFYRSKLVTQGRCNTWVMYVMGFPSGASGKEPACSEETKETWVWSLVGEIPWRRVWQPTPVFMPRESHGQRSP